MQKARSEAATKRTDQPARTPAQQASDAKRFMKHAPQSDKARLIVEALEHDPEVFADQAVIDAAAMAVSAQFTPREKSEGTKAAEKRTEQIAFLAYLTSVNVDLKGAEKALAESGELSEDQQKAAGQLLDRAAEGVARLITKIGSYELARDGS